MMLNIGIIDDDRYKICSQREAKEICDKYVLDQELYLNEFKKRIVYIWSSRYYKNLNRYIRGYIFPSLVQKKQYDSFMALLSELIEKTEGLYEDTILFGVKRTLMSILVS